MKNKLAILLTLAALSLAAHGAPAPKDPVADQIKKNSKGMYRRSAATVDELKADMPNIAPGGGYTQMVMGLKRTNQKALLEDFNKSCLAKGYTASAYRFWFLKHADKLPRADLAKTIDKELKGLAKIPESQTRTEWIDELSTIQEVLSGNPVSVEAKARASAGVVVVALTPGDPLYAPWLVAKRKGDADTLKKIHALYSARRSRADPPP